MKLYVLPADLSAAQIPLSKRDGPIQGYALVDVEDEERVRQWNWNLSGGYARTSVRIDGKRQTIRLHRFILGLQRGDKREGDHINRDRLDCRKANLRIVTRQQGCQNVSGRPKTSQHRGVAYDKTKRRWVAYMNIGRKRVFFARFMDEKSAFEAAQDARQRLMPYSVE